MAKGKHETKVTKRSVDAFKPIDGKRTRLWDTDLNGFCLLAYPTGRKVYAVAYRVNGRGSYKYYSIGKHGDPWTPDRARKEAQVILGNVAVGIDPSSDKIERKNQSEKDGLTVSKLIER